ncbi:D-aminoacyl-tRNA deacylase [Collinsella sp. An307]|uniref:D-aminoacyl-tRNA deacylase n=1 Tax=Collinsella sp. An307 TaxID=1965630 RepID=UPI000B3AF4ED|nr:D-aminoacyl-tRNA deacylase [Collinsella sp. An307]OUO20451.1 D-tyrosyl-tRNA(Tyr) deacylase [Collinsella sp. An307]
MRAVIQRVLQASVTVGEDVVGAIGQGYLILLGVGADDAETEAERLWAKIRDLRICEDEAGKTNLSLVQTEGEVLVVSQFTLYADCRRGRRPSFTAAGDPAQARELYEYFAGLVRRDLGRVETGSFGAHMQVSLVNDGPFTIVLDTADL